MHHAFLGTPAGDGGNIQRLEGWVEIRTGGPEQGPSTEPGDHEKRQRKMRQIGFAAAENSR